MFLYVHMHDNVIIIIGFQMTQSLGGGTGAGFGTKLMTKIRVCSIIHSFIYYYWSIYYDIMNTYVWYDTYMVYNEIGGISWSNNVLLAGGSITKSIWYCCWTL